MSRDEEAAQIFGEKTSRERMRERSGLSSFASCHPERSEGSGWPHSETLRCAQDDIFPEHLYPVKIIEHQHNAFAS
jgi:hypothetical protein